MEEQEGGSTMVTAQETQLWRWLGYHDGQQCAGDEELQLEVEARQYDVDAQVSVQQVLNPHRAGEQQHEDEKGFEGG